MSSGPDSSTPFATHHPSPRQKMFQVIEDIFRFLANSPRDRDQDETLDVVRISGAAWVVVPDGPNRQYQIKLKDKSTSAGSSRPENGGDGGESRDGEDTAKKRDDADADRTEGGAGGAEEGGGVGDDGDKGGSDGNEKGGNAGDDDEESSSVSDWEDDPISDEDEAGPGVDVEGHAAQVVQKGITGAGSQGKGLRSGSRGGNGVEKRMTRANKRNLDNGDEDGKRTFTLICQEPADNDVEDTEPPKKIASKSSSQVAVQFLYTDDAVEKDGFRLYDIPEVYKCYTAADGRATRTTPNVPEWSDLKTQKQTNWQGTRFKVGETAEIQTDPSGVGKSAFSLGHILEIRAIANQHARVLLLVRWKIHEDDIKGYKNHARWTKEYEWFATTRDEVMPNYSLNSRIKPVEHAFDKDIVAYEGDKEIRPSK